MPFANDMLVSSLKFPNASLVIFNMLSESNFSSQLLLEKMADLGHTQFSAENYTNETKIEMKRKLLESSFTKISDIIAVTKEEARAEVSALLETLITGLEKSFGSTNSSENSESKILSNQTQELINLNKQMSQTLNLLTQRIVYDQNKINYNRSPQTPPPGFNPNINSLKRFFQTGYTQWRSEQRLDPNDDYIYFHKCFPISQQKNIFKILSDHSGAGMDKCLQEISKFFALNDLEVLDLQEKFLCFKASNKSPQDVFNSLFDLKYSISPTDSDQKIVSDVKNQFIRSYRSTQNSAIKNLFSTERWRSANTLDGVLKILNQTRIEQGNQFQTLGNRQESVNSTPSQEQMDCSNVNSSHSSSKFKNFSKNSGSKANKNFGSKPNNKKKGNFYRDCPSSSCNGRNPFFCKYCQECGKKLPIQNTRTSGVNEINGKEEEKPVDDDNNLNENQDEPVFNISDINNADNEVSCIKENDTAYIFQRNIPRQNRAKLPLISIKFHSEFNSYETKFYKALFDTGARLDYMSKNLFERIKSRYKLSLSNDSFTHSGANGSKIDCIGITSTTVTVRDSFGNEEKVKATFRVVDGLSHSLIMGTTLMKNSCRSNGFILYPETLEINMKIEKPTSPNDKRKKSQLCAIVDGNLTYEESYEDLLINLIEPVKADKLVNVGTDNSPILIGRQRSKTFQDEVKNLIMHKHKSLFSGNTDPYIGVSANVEFTQKVPPGGHGYIPATKQQQEILGLKMRKLVNQKVGKWTDEPSNCSMFLVDKENNIPKDQPEAWRPVTNLVHLNRFVKPTEYNSEPIGLLVQNLQQGKVFNKFDIPNAYFGLSYSSSCGQKIIAKVPGQKQNFEFLRTPQGLKTSSNEFNRAMDIIFEGIPVVRYSDDCSQHGISEQDLLKKLDQFLTRCKRHNVPLSLKKCAFGVDELEFLSYKIIDGRIGISDAHRKAVEQIDGKSLKPDTLAGFLAYFDSYHGDYDLLHCLRDDSPWDDNKQLALDWLKEKILNAPLKALVDFKSKLHIFTDASDTGFSSCLFIEKNNDQRTFLEPVSFYKQNMSNNKSWLNKTVYHRELIALVSSVKRHEYLLKGTHPVEIHCDNQAVTESKHSKSQYVRHFFETLAIEFPNITISHLASKFNCIADILSKAKHSTVTDNCTKVEIPIEVISPVSTRSKTNRVQTQIENKSADSHSPSSSPMSSDNSENSKMLLKLLSFHIRSGHISAERIHSLYLRLYGKNHSSKVTRQQITDKLKMCKCYSPKSKGNFIPVKPSINGELYLDFKTIGAHSCPLKNGVKGYRLSIIEPLSGAIWSIPVPVTTGSQLVDIMRIVLQIHGLVGTIKADNAPTFIKGEFEKFCAGYDIKLSSITPGNAQANSSERQHSQVNKAIVMANNLAEKITLAESKEVLFDFVISHNLVKKRNTRYCPLEIMKGHLPPECTKIFGESNHEQPNKPASEIVEDTWLERSKGKLEKTPSFSTDNKFKVGEVVFWKVKNPTTEVQYRQGTVVESNETSTCIKLKNKRTVWIVNRFIVSKPNYESMLGL